ncbi:MAG: phosphate/phosphite/phosphonate ABC transporter substrate-binding protein [Pseudomonadota bacterium]
MGRVAAFLLLAVLALSGPTGTRAGGVYTLAVVPQFTPVDLGLRWTPLLKRLQRDTGLVLQLRVMERMPAFEEDFLRGGPDFVYLNPYHMVLAARRQGYVPLVRGGQNLSGILVVDAQGPVKSLADLRDARLAFPSPNAFGASLYLRALLTEKEGIPFSPLYVGTHQNVYRHVLLAQAAAGGGVSATLDREPSSVRSRLRILYRTPQTPSHPLAAHPRVPGADREKLAGALLALNREPAGRQLLAAVELDEVTPADFVRDYQPLQALRLDRYLVLDGK